VPGHALMTIESKNPINSLYIKEICYELFRNTYSSQMYNNRENEMRILSMLVFSNLLNINNEEYYSWLKIYVSKIEINIFKKIIVPLKNDSNNILLQQYILANNRRTYDIKIIDILIELSTNTWTEIFNPLRWFIEKKDIHNEIIFIKFCELTNEIKWNSLDNNPLLNYIKNNTDNLQLNILEKLINVMKDVEWTSACNPLCIFIESNGLDYYNHNQNLNIIKILTNTKKIIWGALNNPLCLYIKRGGNDYYIIKKIIEITIDIKWDPDITPLHLYIEKEIHETRSNIINILIKATKNIKWNTLNNPLNLYITTNKFLDNETINKF